MVCQCVIALCPFHPKNASDDHTYLILSQVDSTMVLQTGQEITELDSSGFATQAPTIFAGNMSGGCYIVQVRGTGRDGTGRDGTGRDGTGRDGTEGGRKEGGGGRMGGWVGSLKGGKVGRGRVSRGKVGRG